MTNETPVEFDFSILDKNLEDIEDLPGFEVPPQGTYQFLVNAEAKYLPPKEGDKGDRPVVVLDYEVTGIVQLADPIAIPPVIGDKFGELFMLGNEYGEANMKKALAPYAAHFGTTNITTLIREKLNNVVVVGTVKYRFNKEKDPRKENPYASVVNVVVA